MALYNHFCCGEFIIRCGDLDDNLYIIRHGKVCNVFHVFQVARVINLIPKFEHVKPFFNDRVTLLAYEILNDVHSSFPEIEVYKRRGTNLVASDD